MIVKFIDCQQSTSPNANMSTIKSLREKMLSPSLDPKLRRALLRVLNKLEKGTFPIDPDTELSDEDFQQIFGQAPAPSEDLGSIESKELQDDKKQTIAPTNLPVLSSTFSSTTNGENKDENNFNGNLFTYIPPKVELTKPTISKNKAEDVEYPSKVYSYIPPLTETTSQSNQPTKPTPEQNEVYFQVPTPIDIPEQVDEEIADREYLDQNQEIDDQPLEEPKEELDLTNNGVVEENDTDDATNSTDSVLVSESITREVKETNTTTTNGTEKVYKHDVEFFPSSLVAAFTVQQDDKGIPRKVIPLDDLHQRKVLVEKKQQELAEKEYRLQQQLKSLQEEKYRFHGALNQDNILPKITRLSTISTPILSSTNIYPDLINIQEQRIQNIERQRLFREQEYQRQEQYRQQEINRLKENLRQQEILRNQELERQQRQRQFQNFNRPLTPPSELFPPNPTAFNNYQTNNFRQFQKQQNIEFQKSVDYRLPTGDGLLRTPNHQSQSIFDPLSNYQHLPTVELNRVNRNEPSYFIGNYRNNPPTVDFQLQNLIAQSGLSSFISSDNKDDLNIVSKVLSLNHGGFVHDSIGRHSERVSLYVTPPANVIEPPIV